jgi:hypothetical protein
MADDPLRDCFVVAARRAVREIWEQHGRPSPLGIHAPAQEAAIHAAEHVLLAVLEVADRAFADRQAVRLGQNKLTIVK